MRNIGTYGDSIKITTENASVARRIYALVKDIYDKTKKYDKVLILQSSTNIDRVVSMYKAMKKSKKIIKINN